MAQNQTLYLLKYNNYYNRIVKKENNLSDYFKNNQLLATVQNVNFIPNDYVNTTQVVNISNDIQPNYLIVATPSGEIMSRWFIVDEQRQNWAQIVLTLHRDLVVDYYEAAINATCFIEKCTLPENNDLIFNSESMTFNKIKQSELLIKDKSECPWLVIYASQLTTDEDTNKKKFNQFTIDGTQGQQSIAAAYSFGTITDFQNSALYKASQSGDPIEGGEIRIKSFELNTIRKAYTYDLEDNKVFIPEDDELNMRTYEYYPQTDESYKRAYFNDDKHFYIKEDYSADYIGQKFSPIVDDIEYELQFNFTPDESYDPEGYKQAIELANQIVEYIDGQGHLHYYQVEVTPYESKGWRVYTVDKVNKIFTDYIKPIQESIAENDVTESDMLGCCLINYYNAAIKVKLTPVAGINVKFDITGNQFHCADAPYDLFCMPYSDNVIITNSKLSGSFKNVFASKRLALFVAKALAAKYSGTGTVIDAQLLPYCPLVNTSVTKENSGLVNININSSNMKWWTPIYDQDVENQVDGYILHATSSSFNRIIELEEPVIIKDYKVESECDMYRLCSPNYNGVFEFNAAKNGGINQFNISCTYKPFNPYIKVYPNWGRLYGRTEFNDARGLICGGDFSLPMTSDAWDTYELQNKNYQNSFDRDIQNLELTQSVERKKEGWQIAMGTLQGTAAGMGAGAMMGSILPGSKSGVIGAGIGAAAGFGLSLAGGLIDQNLNNQLRDEAINYKQDQFGYQLGNIKALPQSLTKVTAYNTDNKYFPFLEYYSCTYIEKNALKDKIKYNGMTAMVIGQISKYQMDEPTYIKAKFIRAEQGMDSDYHITNALADELDKGVFI